MYVPLSIKRLHTTFYVFNWNSSLNNGYIEEYMNNE